MWWGWWGHQYAYKKKRSPFFFLPPLRMVKAREGTLNFYLGETTLCFVIELLSHPQSYRTRSGKEAQYI